MMSTGKVTEFTADEVFARVQKRTDQSRHPMDAADIFAGFVPAGTRIAVTSATEVFRHVSRAAAMKVLDELTQQGRLVRHTGHDWNKLYGVRGYGQASNVTYYATAADADKWEGERVRLLDAHRMREARDKATAVLLERHAAEYQDLIDKFKSELDAASGVTRERS